jgi:hypothetical protein
MIKIEIFAVMKELHTKSEYDFAVSKEIHKTEKYIKI